MSSTFGDGLAWKIAAITNSASDVRIQIVENGNEFL